MTSEHSIQRDVAHGNQCHSMAITSCPYVTESTFTFCVPRFALFCFFSNFTVLYDTDVFSKKHQRHSTCYVLNEIISPVPSKFFWSTELLGATFFVDRVKIAKVYYHAVVYELLEILHILKRA